MKSSRYSESSRDFSFRMLARLALARGDKASAMKLYTADLTRLPKVIKAAMAAAQLAAQARVVSQLRGMNPLSMTNGQITELNRQMESAQRLGQRAAAEIKDKYRKEIRATLYEAAFFPDAADKLK